VKVEEKGGILGRISIIAEEKGRRGKSVKKTGGSTLPQSLSC
jgi:hypothetical protein